MALYPPGSLLVISDNAGSTAAYEQACVLSPTGLILGNPWLPSSEQGELLAASGFTCIAAEGANATYAAYFKVFDRDYNLLVAVAAQPTQSSISPVRGDGNATFYIPQVNRVMFTMNASGVVGATTWTLPVGAVTITCGTPNRAGTIYYWGDDSVNHAKVERYNLAVPGAMATLFDDGGTTTEVGRDILINGNGDILVVCKDTSVGTVWTVRIYHPDGTLVRTDAVGTSVMTAPRIALGADDPTSYWIMSFPVNGTSRFRKIRTSDGVQIGSTVDKAQRATDPVGPAGSCPLLLTPSAATAASGTPTVIPPPALSWRLHRSDTKPRGEQTA